MNLFEAPRCYTEHLLNLHQLFLLLLLYPKSNYTNSCPKSTAFMRYIKDVWRLKTPIWCVGARHILYVSQNTNAAIESYHSNLKSILNSTNERFVGDQMD